MSSERGMIERVARVLCEQEGRDPDEVCIGEGAATGKTWFGWQAFETNARKVLIAVRGLTDAELRAGGASEYVVAHGDYREFWHGAIDAALAEESARVDHATWHSTIPDIAVLANIYKAGHRDPDTGEVTWFDITSKEE
jgi:hypothetical protein